MEKVSFSAQAKTSSASLAYKVHICQCTPVQCIPMENQTAFKDLCQTGCRNYGQKWSCPPCSPPFGQFTKDWKWLYVLYMKIYTNQFSYIKNPYLKVKAGNAILKSRADKFLAGLAREYGCYISTGSCRRCKPCRRKLLQPCAHPNSMAYSFEALGINVGELVDLCFQQPLLWYAKGYLPEYTAVVCGLLTQETLPMEFLKTAYLDCIKE